MPAIAQEAVRGYAHCPTPICPGNAQEQVDAVRVETGYTCIENGGDLPMIERSMVSVRFADEGPDMPPSKDAPCPHCGLRRELALEPRKQYDALSGFDPNYLADVARGNAPAFDPAAVNTEADERVAALEAQVALLLKAKGD